MGGGHWLVSYVKALPSGGPIAVSGRQPFVSLALRVELARSNLVSSNTGIPDNHRYAGTALVARPPTSPQLCCRHIKLRGQYHAGGTGMGRPAG
jgi:hypothetical protein